MFQAPDAGSPKSKTVNDKTYYWCPGNGAHKPKWVRHEPSTCKGLEGTAEGGTPVDNSTAPPPAASESAVGWSAAMQATVTDLG